MNKLLASAGESNQERNAMSIFGTQRELTPSLIVVYVLVGLLFVRIIYKSFLVPLTDVASYIERANRWLSFFRARTRAVTVLKKALQLPGITEAERDELYFRIGNVYYLMRDYKGAVPYYEKMEHRLDMKYLPYDPGYLHMIMSYFNAGKRDKARELYRVLLKKESHDSRFGRVETLNKRLFG